MMAGVPDRRPRSLAHDRERVLDALPGLLDWRPAVRAQDLARTVVLPEPVVEHLLADLAAEGRAREAGGLWRAAGA